MKRIMILLLIVSSSAYGQISLTTAQDSSQRKYHISSYSYHEQFIDHKGYGSPLIYTNDGGAAAFGDGDEGTMIVKLDKNGKQQWKRKLTPKGDEMESQSIVQDKLGNYYVFILVYDNTKYRGGCERVIFLNKTGTVVWDKYIGTFTVMNNPTISYIKSLDDGRIALRGHVVTEKPVEGKDPVYHFWEGWINTKGTLTQKSGEVLDWSNPDWKKKYLPE